MNSQKAITTGAIVCRLLKGLHGQKEASKIWSDTLRAYLVNLKFNQCVFDAGVYNRQGAQGMIFLTVYVNGIVIAAKPMDIQAVVQELEAKFELKDLGRVKHLLSMEINFIPGVIECVCHRLRTWRGWWLSSTCRT